MMLLTAEVLIHYLVRAVFAAFLIVVWQGFNIPNRIKTRHIPGPTPTWLLGNGLTINKTFHMFLPAALQYWGKLYGPVFKFFVGSQPMIVIRDAEMLKTICVQHQKPFMNRMLFYPPMTDTQHKMIVNGMLFAKGTFWLGIRGAAQPMFHSQGLQSYVKIMDAAAVQHRDALKEAARTGQVIDISQSWGNLSLKVIGESAFGVEFDALKPADTAGVKENVLVRSAHTVSELAIACLTTMMMTPPLLRPMVYELLKWRPQLVPQLHTLQQARGRVYMAGIALASNVAKQLGVAWEDKDNMQQEFIRAEGAQELYDQYKDAMPSEGSLVHMLVRAKNKETGKPLTPLEVVTQLTTITITGHDTTAMLMTSFVYQLSQHKAAQARVLQEIDAFGRHRDVKYEDLDQFPYMEACMNECLRLLSPVPITTRECTEDTTVNHIRIPKGSNVVFDLYGIHRDPRYWVNPEAFRPEHMLQDSEEAKSRHQYAFAPFGVGARMCIGYKFALQEAKIALCRLYQQYTCELADTQKVPAQLRFGIASGFKDGMKVRVLPRA